VTLEAVGSMPIVTVRPTARRVNRGPAGALQDNSDRPRGVMTRQPFPKAPPCAVLRARIAASRSEQRHGRDRLHGRLTQPRPPHGARSENNTVPPGRMEALGGGDWRTTVTPDERGAIRTRMCVPAAVVAVTRVARHHALRARRAALPCARCGISFAHLVVILCRALTALAPPATAWRCWLQPTGTNWQSRARSSSAKQRRSSTSCSPKQRTG
jgi:hypothetical protein